MRAHISISNFNIKKMEKKLIENNMEKIIKPTNTMKNSVKLKAIAFLLCLLYKIHRLSLIMNNIHNLV